MEDQKKKYRRNKQKKQLINRIKIEKLISEIIND